MTVIMRVRIIFSQQAKAPLCCCLLFSTHFQTHHRQMVAVLLRAEISSVIHFYEIFFSTEPLFKPFDLSVVILRTRLLPVILTWRRPYRFKMEAWAGSRVPITRHSLRACLAGLLDVHKVLE